MKYSSAKYRAWYEAVKARDDSTCQFEKCGLVIEDSEAHHVYGKIGSLRYNVDNGIYLCPRCHRAAHANLKAFRTWFETKYPERAKRIAGAKIAELTARVIYETWQNE